MVKTSIPTEPEPVGHVSTLTRLRINVDTFFAGDGNSDFFGNMDDINFYDVALSPTQIGELYSSNIVTSIGGGGQYLPLNTPVNITTSGAALDLNNQVQTIGSLAGVAGSSVLLGSGTSRPAGTTPRRPSPGPSRVLVASSSKAQAP